MWYSYFVTVPKVLNPTRSVISLKRRAGLPMYNKSVRNDGARFRGLMV